MSERRRRLFPEAFKWEAVERVAISGLPIVRVAEELGLGETVLRRWRQLRLRLDNAPMKSFFHTLKVERAHQRIYPTRDAARRDLFHDIEGFYNSHRLHSALGYRSTADAERMEA